MRGKIKIGAIVSQERSVGRWPATVDGDPIDPEMLFDMTWTGMFWDCVADGYGIHEPGKYGNGSIFVHDKDGVIYDSVI